MDTIGTKQSSLQQKRVDWVEKSFMSFVRDCELIVCLSAFFNENEYIMERNMCVLINTEC
jgi:hypothetical protein